MKKRAACPRSDVLNDVANNKKGGKKSPKQQEESFEHTKIADPPSGGYLIGRHPECGTFPAVVGMFFARQC